MQKQYQYLERAIGKVTGMLQKKKDIWVNNQPTFAQFDSVKQLGLKPLQFALAMCQLKMNRLVTRYNDGMGETTSDADLEDSLIDLASYAILALGILYRDRAAKQNTDIFTDAYIHTDQGKQQVKDVAEKMMKQRYTPTATEMEELYREEQYKQ